jgi:hypothetical protein
MSERVRKALVYASLPLALLWAFYSFSERRHQAKDSPSTHTVQPAGVVTAAAATPIDFEAFRKKSWGSDPFRSYLTVGDSSRPASPRTPWRLNGIVYSETQPMAFINGRAVSIGDTIKTAVVVAIDRKTVTLDLQGKRLVLEVNKG